MSVSGSELSVTVPSTPMSSFSTLSEASSPVRSATRRHNSRFSVQIVVFEAGGVIFEVPRYGVPQSPIIAAFEARFPCSRDDPTSSGPGSSVDNPILVDNVTESEFCSLLTAIYPPPGHTALLELTSEEWTVVFRLTKILGLPLLRATAFNHLDEAISSKSSIEKITIGRQLEEVKWIQSGFREIAVRNGKVTKEEHKTLGTDTYMRLLELRDHLSDAVLSSHVRIFPSTYEGKKMAKLTDKVLHEFLGVEVGGCNASPTGIRTA